MIDFIKGKLMENGNGWLVVENNGIGYRIEVPVSLNARSWHEGDECTIYTKMVLREDGLYLYGFANMEERNLFNLITGVSGFGPKAALSVLGITTVSQFYIAIIDDNIKSLCTIPGIGKKSAQRLILELKEKLPAVFPEAAGREVSVSLPDTGALSPREESLRALCSLGYTAADAGAVIESIIKDSPEAATEDLVKAALKKMSKL